MHKMILLTGLTISILLFGAVKTDAQWVKTGVLPGQPVFALASSDSDLFCSPYYFGAYISTNNGDSWSQIDSGLSFMWISSFAVSDTNLFAGSLDGVFRTTDNGAYWTLENNGMVDVKVISLAVSGTNIFAGTDEGIYLSTDNGASWTLANNGLTDFVIYSLAATDSVLLAGTDSSIYLSTNNGASWTQKNNGLPSSPLGRISLAVVGNNYFAGTRGYGVYVSTDGGENWAARNNGLTDTTVLAFAVAGENIFAGTGVGAFLSTDLGMSWSSVSEGLPNEYPYILSFTVLGDYIFAGGDYGSVWRRPLSEMITNVKDDQSNLALSYSLKQNYPNPFNPATKIKYVIPQLSVVTIKIFGILGNEIETLINEEKPAGIYEVTWNAANLPSGVYFYQLQAGSYIDTKKMILLK